MLFLQDCLNYFFLFNRRYLLEIAKVPNTAVPIIEILIQIARHSADAAKQVFEVGFNTISIALMITYFLYIYKNNSAIE